MKALGILVLIAVSTTASQAFAGGCFERRSPGYVQPICNGIHIPESQTRNFDNHALQCAGNSDIFVRRPQKFDFNRWSTLATSDDKQVAKMANLERRDPKKVPDIYWTGQIPYETVETWTYEECEYHTNGAECGYNHVCENVEENECSSDSKGRQHCHEVSREECHDEPKACWYDVEYSGSMHCSDEVVNYQAKFKRPTWNEWNPEKDGKVAEVLPNKYDLLPGELENIQTYNNTSLSPTLNPVTKIENAWNKYQIAYGGSAVGGSCQQGKTYELKVLIDTEGRKIGKKAPNALRLPVDVEGHKVDPFGGEWTTGIDRKTGKPVNLRPAALYLADSSSAMIESISEISRKNTAREVNKVEKGYGANRDGVKLESNDPLAQSFQKQTVVRVQLFEKNRLWWDTNQLTYAKEGLRLKDAEVVVASDNINSKDEEIRNADTIKFKLDDPNARQNIYKRMQMGLRPNRVYELRVSMYQEGVPFYNQSCADNPHRWICLGIKWNGWWDREFQPFNNADAYFSDPVKIDFQTPAVEQRTAGQKFWGWMYGISSLGLDPLAEWIVHQRPTNGVSK